MTEIIFLVGIYLIFCDYLILDICSSNKAAFTLVLVLHVRTFSLHSSSTWPAFHPPRLTFSCADKVQCPSRFAHITGLGKPAMLMSALVLLLSVLLMYSNI